MKKQSIIGSVTMASALGGLLVALTAQAGDKKQVDMRSPAKSF